MNNSEPTDVRTIEEKKKSLESKHIRDVNPEELKGKAKAWAIEEKAKYAKEIEDWNNENPEHKIEL